MKIRIEPQDCSSVNPESRATAENPVLRAINRTLGTGATTSTGRTIGKMPVFDEDSLRAGRSMPQLYVLSTSDPLSPDFQVLPAPAQSFLRQWYAGEAVGLISFELELPGAEPLTPAETGDRVYDLTAAMDEGYPDPVSMENAMQRDFETLKRGLARFVSEGGKELGLGPVREGVSKLNAIGQMPVSTIGRELGRLLVMPIGPSTKAKDESLKSAHR